MLPWRSLSFSLLVTAAIGAAFGCSTDSQAERVPVIEEVPDGEERNRIVDVDADENARKAPFAFTKYLTPWQPVEVRARAALALGRLQHFDAIKPLRAAAQDPAPTVRREAAFGLGQVDLILAPENPADASRRALVIDGLAPLLDDDVADVRVSALRAWGRVGAAPHFGELVRVANDARRHVSERAAALTALGVSVKRRPLPAPHPGIEQAALSVLKSPDVGLRRAALYAVFRNHTVLKAADVTALEKDKDATVRVLLARALVDAPGHHQAAQRLSTDADWRVIVEAVAAARRQKAVTPSVLNGTLVKHVARLRKNPNAPGSAHIVGAICEAFVNAPRDQTRSALKAAVASLREPHSAAGCRCAVALDAQDARLDAVKRCGADTSARALLGVEVAQQANLSAAERASWVATALSDPDRIVRVRAAQVLAAERTAAARRFAAKALEREQDPAVASALLAAFEGAENNAIQPTLVMTLLERFEPETTFERAEPLMTILRLAAEHPVLEYARAELTDHPLPHVASAARWRHGERSPLLLTPPMPHRPAANLPRVARVETRRGVFVVQLERSRAPLTVDNFATLASRGFYKGTRFHRVVPDFVVQGGDPQGDGSGGPGYTIACENTDARYERGTVGMALAGQDTGGSQFFVTHSPQPHLDGRYTVFGRVIEGMDVVDALVPGDEIVSVEVGQMPDGHSPRPEAK